MASVTRKWTCPVESSAASLWHEGAAGSADRGGVLAARWPTAGGPVRFPAEHDDGGRQAAAAQAATPRTNAASAPSQADELRWVW